MRLTIRVSLKSGKTAPYDHNYLLASAFLAVLKEHDPELSSILHDNLQTSSYVISEMYPARGEPALYYFCVGSSNDKLLELIDAAFRPGIPMRIASSAFEVVDVKQEQTPNDLPSPIEVATLSPVLVKNPNDHSRCVIPSDEGYLEIINELIKVKIDRFVGPSEWCRVMRVAPRAIRQRHISGGMVLATKGHFYLEGTPSALRFILEHGLGANTAMGFGFVVPSGRW